jgi:hypothetical protein
VALLPPLPGITPAASAQVISEAAGIWHNVAMSTPAHLSWSTDPLGRLVWVSGLNDFEVWNAAFTVSADGHFTGPATGTFSVAGPGLIRATVPGNQVADFAINSRSDFMASVKSSSDGNQQDLELLLKAPTDLTAADLAGTWRGFNLLTPSRIDPIWQENLVVGLDPIGRFLVRMGSLTVAGDGTIAGDMGGPFTGWVTIGQDGAVFVNLNETPPDPPTILSFFVNAGKDILAASVSDSDGSQELVLFIRTPTSTSSPDLKGYWRSADFSVPTHLTLLTNAVGEAFGIEGAYDFDFYRDIVSTGHNGGIVGLADPFVGEATTGAGGWVHIAGTNDYGEIITEDLWANAGQDVLLRVETAEHQELGLALKAPSSPEADVLASKLVCLTQDDCLVVAWASDENRTLQSSTNLVDWTTVEGSTDAGQVSVCPPGAPRTYYRIVIAP